MERGGRGKVGETTFLKGSGQSPLKLNLESHNLIKSLPLQTQAFPNLAQVLIMGRQKHLKWYVCTSHSDL